MNVSLRRIFTKSNWILRGRVHLFTFEEKIVRHLVTELTEFVLTKMEFVDKDSKK